MSGGGIIIPLSDDIRAACERNVNKKYTVIKAVSKTDKEGSWQINWEMVFW